MPLLRMGGERIMRAPYTVPDRFAGSIIDLQPDTEYEVRLTMKDPDGVAGTAVQDVQVRTRAEPRAAAGGRTIHVYPLTWPADRPKENPNVTGLMAAYNGYVGTGDWNVVALGASGRRTRLVMRSRSCRKTASCSLAISASIGGRATTSAIAMPIPGTGYRCSTISRAGG